jgi:hypothetical protein
MPMVSLAVFDDRLTVAGHARNPAMLRGSTGGRLFRDDVENP